MKRFFRQLIVIMCLSLTLGLIAYDSLPHFDESLIQLKRNHRSAQRNWNVFYGQRFVYFDSSFRYQKDLAEIKKLIEPGHLLLTDYATSYYASSSLPVYTRNVQRHHGRPKSKSWRKMLDSRSACYLGQPDKFSQFKKFLAIENYSSRSNDRLELRYAITNKDSRNLNLRYDCLWNGRDGFITHIERLATLKYEGDHINLYEFNMELTSAAFDSH